jgi:hypothetical protein
MCASMADREQCVIKAVETFANQDGALEEGSEYLST